MTFALPNKVIWIWCPLPGQQWDFTPSDLGAAQHTLRAYPPPHSARPVPHGRPVGLPSPRQGASRVACVSLLCTCCRHYPDTVTGDTALLILPVLSAFPAMAGRSALASAFSRISQRSLTLRPAHSLDHLKRSVTSKASE